MKYPINQKLLEPPMALIECAIPFILVENVMLGIVFIFTIRKNVSIFRDR